MGNSSKKYENIDIKLMKDEYLIWKRMEEMSKSAIRTAEENIYVNKHLLQLAKVHIKELERAGKVPQKKLK